MKYKLVLSLLIVLLFVQSTDGQGFLKTDGKQIVDGDGKPVLLKGIGLGGWMLQEPYMFELSDVAKNQTEIRAKITELIGEKSCEEFYRAFRNNMLTERDVDSLKTWGFNSVRLPMHYNLFTQSVDKEFFPGEHTWLKTGFELTDNLLAWCKKNKIYLILDLHAAPGGQGNDIPIADIDTLRHRLWESADNINKTVALWKKLAERYGKDEWIGGYDLLNETNYKMEGNKVLKTFFLSLTHEIRSVDKNHILFIEGNQFATDFEGLTPPWDENMVYSFHKYWNPPTKETIQKYLFLRDTTNIPLWMGESGENTTEWFRDVVKLLETNDIGWAWWTIKKIGSESSLMTITRPEGYQKLIDYWTGKGPRPTEEEAKATLMKLAENVKLENCKINYPVIVALLGRK